MLPRTGTMQSSRLPSGALLCALLLLSGAAVAEVQDTESEEELSPRALRDFYPKGPNLTSEKQLVSPAPPLPLCIVPSSTLVFYFSFLPHVTYFEFQRHSAKKGTVELNANRTQFRNPRIKDSSPPRNF